MSIRAKATSCGTLTMYINQQQSEPTPRVPMKRRHAPLTPHTTMMALACVLPVACSGKPLVLSPAQPVYARSVAEDIVETVPSTCVSQARASLASMLADTSPLEFPRGATLFGRRDVSTELVETERFYVEAKVRQEAAQNEDERRLAECDLATADAYEGLLVSLASDTDIEKKYPHDSLQVSNVSKCANARDARKAIEPVLTDAKYRLRNSWVETSKGFTWTTSERAREDLYDGLHIVFADTSELAGEVHIRFYLLRSPGGYNKKQVLDPEDADVTALHNDLDELLGRLKEALNTACGSGEDAP